MKRFILSLVLMVMPLASAYADMSEYWLHLIEGLEAEHLPKLDSIDGLIGSLKSDMQKYMYGVKYGNGVDEQYQTWGSAKTWDDFLLTKGSEGGDDLSRKVYEADQQFPVDKAVGTLKDVNKSEMDQKYYTLQAQTARASRAASQHEFDQIEKEIQYQKQLEKDASSAQDLKASVDIQNKLQVENNLILLSVLRQLSLANQQKALETQEAVNGVFENASFLKNK